MGTPNQCTNQTPYQCTNQTPNQGTNVRRPHGDSAQEVLCSDSAQEVLCSDSAQEVLDAGTTKKVDRRSYVKEMYVTTDYECIALASVSQLANVCIPRESIQILPCHNTQECEIS